MGKMFRPSVRVQTFDLNCLLGFCKILFFVKLLWTNVHCERGIEIELSFLLIIPVSFSPQDLMTVQAELSESLMLRQKLEDTLRQRERELTALKGALKDEVESHDKEMESLREEYSQDMDALRHSMETVSQVKNTSRQIPSG